MQRCVERMSGWEWQPGSAFVSLTPPLSLWINDNGGLLGDLDIIMSR